jgi:hypothetical protein
LKIEHGRSEFIFFVGAQHAVPGKRTWRRAAIQESQSMVWRIFSIKPSICAGRSMLRPYKSILGLRLFANQ